MTPEERERTMEFILASQARSAFRMDRLEEDLSRLEHDLVLLREDVTELAAGQKNVKENVDGLLQVTNKLLRISEMSFARINRLEGRSDAIEEVTKVLRELLEATLRRPDQPGN